MKIVFLMLLISGTAQALPLLGNDQGNGGDAVICTSNYTLKAELLDVFEGRILHKMKLNFPASAVVGNLSTDQISQYNAHKLAERVEKFNPLLAKKYHEYIDSFMDEVSFVTGVELVDIPDANGIIIPVDCKIAQLVVQIADGSFGSKRYVINYDIWRLLDGHNKAAVIFHEVVYRLAIETGQTDSRWTRYFNAVVFSDNISNMTNNQFVSLRKQAYSQKFVHNGFELAGKINSGQKFYQIISAPQSLVGINIDDGIFDMEQNYMTEGQSVGPNTAFKDLIFPNGLSMTFSKSGMLEQVYASDVKETRFGIKITPSTYEACHWEQKVNCSIINMKWDILSNSFLLQPNQLKYDAMRINISFDNHVQINFKVDGELQFSESMSKLQMLSQFCNSGMCPKVYVKYSSGQLVDDWGNNNPIDQLELNNVKLQVIDESLISYESMALTTVSYKVPANYTGDPKVVSKIFETYAVQFSPNGDYTFTSEIRFIKRKLVLRDGTIIELSPGWYEFTFDKEGYLLGAANKP